MTGCFWEMLKVRLTAYANDCIYWHMNQLAVYKGLCDWQRVRMLHLLWKGPMCVCHIMETLDEAQVKVSKQLAYLKSLDLVEQQRVAQWSVYRLKAPVSLLLLCNLETLSSLEGEAGDQLRADLGKRCEVLSRVACEDAPCAAVVLNESSNHEK
jgi:ArsR family transcriptional regulator